TGAQLLPEELIQRFLLSLPSEPQWLAVVQIAHHRDELLLLSQVDLVYAHPRQRGFAPTGGPPLQIAKIDGSHGARCQPETQGNLSGRCALARLPDRILKTLTERRLAGQLRHPLHLDAAVRTAHPVDFDHHRRPEFHARQIAHFPLADFVRFVQSAPASRANQLLIAPFASNPKLESLCPFVDLVPVYPIPRPSKQFGKVAVSQTASVPKSRPLRNPSPA